MLIMTATVNTLAPIVALYINNFYCFSFSLALPMYMPSSRNWQPELTAGLPRQHFRNSMPNSHPGLFYLFLR